MLTMHSLRSKRGFALMDLMLYMIIFSVLAAFAAKVKLSADQDKADQAAGQHLAVIRDGVQQYIDLYRSQLLAGIGIAGVTTLLTPTVAELQGLNNPPVMSTSIGVQGGNGQTYSITLTRLPAGCAAGVNCTDLFALISSTQPWMGDDGLPQTVRLANMAATVGGDGAIVDPSATTTLKGADGTWAGVANPYGNAEGYVFARAGFGSVTDIKLHSLLPRDGSRGITNIVTRGQACTVPNGLGADASGRIFSCQGGTYQLANGSGNISDIANQGAACTDDGALAKSAADTTAILICSSGTWSLGAGNNVVLRDGSRSMLADLNMGGNSLTNANDVGASGTVTANNVTASGRVTSGDALLTRTITAGTGCSPDGLLAKDSTGMLYSCQSGTWRRAAGSSGGVVTKNDLASVFSGRISEWDPPYVPYVCGARVRILGNGDVYVDGYCPDPYQGPMVNGEYYVGNLSSPMIFTVSTHSECTTDGWGTTACTLMTASYCGGNLLATPAIPGGMLPGDYCFFSNSVLKNGYYYGPIVAGITLLKGGASLGGFVNSASGGVWLQ